MKFIHFFDFDLQSGSQVLFHNWASINLAVKLNPQRKIFFWLTKEMTTNYLLVNLIENIIFMSYEEEFGRISFQNELDEILCKLTVLDKYQGSALDINDLHTAPQTPESGYGYLNLDVKNRKTADLKHNFIINNENSFLSDLLQNLMKSKDLDISFRTEEFWRLIEENSATLNFFPDGKVALISCENQDNLEEIFVEKSSNIFNNSMAFPAKNCLPILSKINERNVYFLDNLFTNTLLKFIHKEIENINSSRDRFLNIQHSSDLTINLGSGSKFDLGVVNIDLYEQAGADLVFDISKPNWPLRDNSVNFAICHSVLEHLGGDLSIFFKELYRVMAPSALVEFILPHPRHDWFFQDPTHVRPLLPISFEHFDRKKSISWYLSSTSHTPLALYWGIDFRIKSLEERIADPQLGEKLSKMNAHSVNLAHYFYNNIIGDYKIVLEAVK